MQIDSLLQRRALPLIVAGNPSFRDPDSQLVTASQFYEPEFSQWLSFWSQEVVLDRKVWEYCYVLRAVDRYVGLSEGRKGVCFGSGKELLPAIMAARGCEVLATDFVAEAEASAGWEARSLEDLFYGDLVDRATFERQVSFRHADMNNIPSDIRGFDFLWSTGSLEHIGGHQMGLRFVKQAMACLKPGGFAVHTTEFTLTSSDVGRDSPMLSFYSQRDITSLAQELIQEGHQLVLNFERGQTPADTHVDTPPFNYGRTLLAHQTSHVITSIGLIVQKGPTAE